MSLRARRTVQVVTSRRVKIANDASSGGSANAADTQNERRIGPPGIDERAADGRHALPRHDRHDPAQRIITLPTPTAVGISIVNLTVSNPSDPSAPTTAFSVDYLASAATTPTSTVLEGSSDDSSAIDAGDGYLLDADDERNSIGLYNGNVSGREVARFGQNGGEQDNEAMARKGDQVYVFGSEGHDKQGRPAPDRNSVVAYTLHGSGANATLTPGVSIAGFRDDLITWDRNHGNWFGLVGDVDKGPVAEEFYGIDLEGAEFSPDGSELYLGMRAPIAPMTPGTPQTPGDKAVIFTVTNFDAVMAAAAAGSKLPHWAIGDPILLDLKGQSIREIRKNSHNQYLIIAGQAGPGGAEVSGAAGNTLWAWDGQPGDQPQRLAADVGSDQPSATLPADPTAHADEAGDWEGIADMPDPLTPGATVRLMMDQGFDIQYGDGAESKDENNPYISKGRTDLFTLSGAAGTVTTLTGDGAFPKQAATTTGTARMFTVTNGGSNSIDIGKVHVTGGSANEFLISQDDCGDTTLPAQAVGDTTLASCTVWVRYAPEAVNAASNATLVVNTGNAGGTATMALTGSSSDLPSGAKGDTGATGQDGATVFGSPGAQGPQGPAGPQGPTGPAGKDGTFAFAAKAQAVSARRGRTVSLAFVVENRTTVAVSGSTATATAPKTLEVSGRRSVKIAALKAGQHRTVTLKLKIGKSAKVGSHTVKVALKINGKSVARSVTIRVTR